MHDVRHEIKRLRIERGWTQAELAKRVGMDRRVIGSIEVGQYPASARLLRAIEVALSVEKGTLLRYVVKRELKKLSEKLLMSQRDIEKLARTKDE